MLFADQTRIDRIGLVDVMRTLAVVLGRESKDDHKMTVYGEEVASPATESQYGAA